MSNQTPSIGRVVHFVYGDVHCAAIITDPAFAIAHPGGGEGVTQALVVFPPCDSQFTTTAEYDPNGAPATWHWPEFVAPQGPS